MTMNGSCLCGTLRYQVDAPFFSMINCHCARCRKHHGAPFATFGIAPAASLKWQQGADAVVAGEAAPGMPRMFCSRCGSPAPTISESNGLAFVPVGTLDDDPGVRADGHYFVGSKAGWYELTDTLPRHDRYAPEMGDAPGLPDPTPAAASEGHVAGSCLCGKVAYELRSPVAMFQCHCRRCRKARGAAHGANLFCKVEDFHWLRGEEMVVDYKLPEARYYAVAFCRQCGSAVPRISLERGIVVVPVSGLDADPGIRPMAHIFVGSKAGWFDITDQLEQFAEGPPSMMPQPPR